MSSEDPRERADLCGTELISDTIVLGIEFEGHDIKTWYETEDGRHYCCREVWDGADTDRCIWHADIADKPPDLLKASLSGVPARLDKASLEGIEFPTGFSFEDCRLREADFSKADFRNADFGGAALINADFGGACLRDSDFEGAKLLEADLRDANLRDVDLNDANLVAADLRDANLADAKLGDAELRDAELRDADLIGANLGRADFHEADLRDADLRGTDHEDVSLFTTNLADAELQGADLGGAVLVMANLEGANLREVDFTDATLRDGCLSDTTFQDANLAAADFEKTDCSRANFFDADLTGAKLYGAVLSDVQLNTNTKFGNHYTDDSDDPDPDKAAWTLRQLERLFRENALPGKAREAYLDRKDRRRQQYWDETFEALQADEPLPGKVRTTTVHARQWFRTALYGATMRYGESPRRVVTLSIGTVLAFGVVYPFFGGMDAGNETTTNYGFEPLVAGFDGLPTPVVDVLANLYFSAVTFTTLGYGDIQPATPVVELLATVESFLGALLMALLVFVLGRRATR